MGDDNHHEYHRETQHETPHETPLTGHYDEARVVASRYRLRSAVGEGGMGVVWLATDLRLDREVALKQLRLPPGLPPHQAAVARQRVFREARVAARLSHPNAVAVFDVTTDDLGQPMLVLEYLPARSLADAIADHGQLPPARVARIGAAVASALAAAHSVGIVHRDVKPGNILLMADGSAKITDFGLSHTVGDVLSGLVAGTPAYLSPEATRGEPPTPESDVYSLGATLYAAVEGAPPFGQSDDPVAQLHRVAAGGAPPPRRAGPLTHLVTRMLDDDPAARPAMSDVAVALGGLAEDPATQPVPFTPPTEPIWVHLDPVAPRSRRRLVYALLGLLAIAVVVLLVITSLNNGGDDAQSASLALGTRESRVQHP